MSIVKQMQADLAAQQRPLKKRGHWRNYQWYLINSVLLIAAISLYFALPTPPPQPLISHLTPLPKLPHWHSIIATFNFPEVQIVNAEPKAYITQNDPIMMDNSSLADLRFNAAKDAFAAGDDDAGLQKLRQALQIDPDHKPARLLLAHWFLDHEEMGAAQQLLQQGLTLSPEFAPYAELLARIALSNNAPEMALHYLQSAHPALKDDPDYYAFLAEVDCQTHAATDAVKIYTQLLQLDSSRPQWWVGLGIALEQTQHPKDALAAYTQASSLTDLPPALQAFVKTRLDALENV